MRFGPHQLAALTAVLRRGSFESAASDLGVTPSAISQRIKELEDQMFGARLSPPAHYLPLTHAFVDAARIGLGWGMNPEQLVISHLAGRTLMPLIADAPLDVPLSLQVSRIMAPTLAPLIRAIRAAAAEGLVQT